MTPYSQTFDEVKLIMHRSETATQKVTNSHEAATLLRTLIEKDTIELYESAVAVFLRANNTAAAWLKVSQGGVMGTVIDLKLVFKAALDCCAVGILLCHNHPSGNIKPSGSDIKLTKRMNEAAKIFDIQLIDHIIITASTHYSLRDNGDY